MDIAARTKRSLEWERLKALLSEQACCQHSRELCINARLDSDAQVVAARLAETKEALAMLTAGAGLSQEGLPELRDALGRLSAQANLSARELLDVRKLLLAARKTKSQLSKLESRDFPQLCKFSPRLHPLADLLKEIDRVFDEDGSVLDSASPLLKSLRRDIQKLGNKIKDELKNIINSSNVSKALQEPLYTLRNGRYVLPVQASMRGSVPGIVHDSSASGLTIYVEPMAVVEPTNNLRLKETELEHEIERIMAQLSSLAQAVAPQLQENLATLVEIDYIAARARLAERYKGVKPELAEDGRLVLKQARHPLLVLQQRALAESSAVPSPVVPNDILLGGDVRTMIITGPNTGGKTVYLKTAGLLSLMLKAGLLLPVEQGSRAVVFENVFADIGDEQSIEQSLSTFSSHMTAILEILKNSRPNTLVLLDEIGAGTDPREGAILARVVLGFLNDSGPLTISTTHYGEMKSLAYTMPGFLNASFQFDEHHLVPTYHLQIGVPGSSKAIEIAARLGMPPELVAAARKHAAEEASDASHVMHELENRLGKVAQAEKELAEKQAQLQLQEQTLAAERQAAAEEKERRRLQIADRMQEEFTQAAELVRSLIADLQKQPSIAKAQKMQADLAALRSELKWLQAPAGETTAAAFSVGQRVRVRSLNQIGTIEAIAGDGRTAGEGVATVVAGAMKIKVPLGDLQPVEGQPAHRKNKSGAARHVAKKHAPEAGVERADVFVRSDRNTLDIRGERVDDGLARLERFVDSAFVDHLSPLMIIHGHGTGQLRAAVRKFLAESPYGVDFRPGESYEGGDGVTVVHLPV